MNPLPTASDTPTLTVEMPMMPVLVYVLVVTSTTWPVNAPPMSSSFVVDNIFTQEECQSIGAKIVAAEPAPIHYQCYPVTKAR